MHFPRFTPSHLIAGCRSILEPDRLAHITHQSKPRGRLKVTVRPASSRFSSGSHRSTANIVCETRIGPAVGCAGRASDPELRENQMLGKLVGATFLLLICIGITFADEIRAVITKVEGDRVTFAEAKGKGQ